MFLDRLMQLHVAAQNKTRWAEKMPDNILYVDRVFAHWPDARFVHILRDPRNDASLNNCGKGGPPEVSSPGLERLGFRRGGDGAKVVGPDRFRTVLSADLVNHPALVMRPIAEFLGLPMEVRRSRRSKGSGMNSISSCAPRKAQHHGKPVSAAFYRLGRRWKRESQPFWKPSRVSWKNPVAGHLPASV